MRKKIIYIASALIVFVAGCTKDFEELDRPKTTTDRMDPGSLFTRALVTGSAMSSSGVWQWKHQIAGSVYAQHFANIQTGANFTSDNYEPMAWNRVWDWYFGMANFAPMHYNYHVINLSREIDNPVMEAVARIWNVYMVQQLTDMYGDMPLEEAFLSVKPSFDAQKDIYLHLLEELKTAIEMIEEYGGLEYEGYGQADVLFEGNLDHWIRFANTMTLRLGLRASNTNEFNSLILPYLEGLEVEATIDRNSHTVKVIPDAGGPTYHVKNPLTFVHGWNEVRMSKTMYDILDALNDPRMQVIAQPNTHGEYVGLPNGQPHELLSSERQSRFIPDYCNIGDFFIQDDTPLFLLTHAEAAFLKAEAAYRGFIAGSARDYYEQGIRASFEQLDIDDPDVVETYLSGEAQFDESMALEQIYTQRWIALFPNGHEAWSLVRRTGHPQMNQPVYTFPGNDEMPRRKPYPDSERLYNAEKYQHAVDRMGGDSQYTRMWWDGGN